MTKKLDKKEQETIYVANTILKQIRMADPTAMLCWGLIKGKSLFMLHQDKTRRGGVKMYTNGHFHQGRVDVDLTWADDYTIKLYDKDGYIIDEVKRIYATELCRVLDMKIESGMKTKVKPLEFVVSNTDNVMHIDLKGESNG